MPGYEPPIPSGNTNLHNWARHTGEVAQRVRRIQFSSGFHGRQTPQGFVPATGNRADEFSFPPGIELREEQICREVIDENGVVTGTETRWIRGYFSIVYNKNDEGQPIDDEGNVLGPETDPPLPDVTGDSDSLTVEEQEGFTIEEG